ncbi:hypothetical protein ACO1O0_007371 [Amphichorda felina]
MADNKRKQGPGGPDSGSAPKKSKGGSGGRWKTPHQHAKMSGRVEMGKALEVGDQGIWVTFARGMKTKAIREITELCEEYGESMYGLPRESDPSPDQEGDEEGEEPTDIAASIEQELSNMRPGKPKARKTFSIVPADVECLLFIKTMKPVEPVEFVRKICQDARDCTDIMKRKTRYVNRLTPVSNMDKSSENGIVKVARSVMAPYFHLVKEEGADESGEGGAGEEPKKDEESGPYYTASEIYSMSQQASSSQADPSSDTVIKKVAGLVRPEHKVKLTSPDKVILIEIYQMFCGVSVVDGAEWESLKRYNMTELYRLASEKDSGESKAEGDATPA